MKHITLLIISVAALLLAFVVGTLLHNAQKENSVSQVPEENRAALIRMHAPTFGKIDAPVVIVEFLDPACETCRDFYPLVKEIMAAKPDQIRLVVRYAPFHKGSDNVVAVLEAARKQGKFWQTLEALLVTQTAWAPHHEAQIDLVWRHLDGLDLDLEKLKADMVSPEITQRIAQDIADARTLNVRKTPEFFVNGRPLVNFGIEPLKTLVDDTLKDTQKETRRR